jgi:hypothetical protein
VIGRCFDRAVGEQAPPCDVAHHRRDRDDRGARPLAQMTDRGLGELERRGDIEVEGGVKRLGSCRLELRWRGPARVVNEKIEPAPTCHGIADQRSER